MTKKIRELADAAVFEHPKKPENGSHIIPEIFTAEWLQCQEFAPLEFVVDQLIIPGLTILAGSPKAGKSWLALQMAFAVATGGKAFGQLGCDQGDVLYLALEDNERRLQSRLAKLYSDVDWPPGFSLATEWVPLDDGGMEALEAWWDNADRPKLIVIDVLGKVRSQRPGSENSYAADYAAAAPLQRFAVDKGIAILVVHHTRKMAAEDPLESVSGTNGLTGAADSVLVLRREAILKGEAVIYGRGRDIAECELALSFDDQTCQWQYIGNADDFRASSQSQEIIDILQGADEAMKPAEIAAQHGSISPQTMRKRLARMVDRGEITKTSYGLYRPVTPVTLSHSELE